MPQDSRSLFAEINDLAASLELERFQALSKGLGLGQAKPATKRLGREPAGVAANEPMKALPERLLFSHLPGDLNDAKRLYSTPSSAKSREDRALLEPTLDSLQRSDFTGSIATAVASSLEDALSLEAPTHCMPDAGRPGAMQPLYVRILKRLIAHSVDAAVVALSLVIVLVAAAFLFAPHHGLFAEGRPVFLAAIEWVSTLSLLEVAALLAGLFFAYLVLFKLMVGSTVGELWLKMDEPSTQEQPVR